MKFLIQLWGEGKDLTILQMSLRGIVVFFFALLLIRISGRRSFGIKTPLDNIIIILLGAILNRAIVGASPFLPIIVCCVVIVLLHRAFSYIVSRNRKIGRIAEGKKILLFEDGEYLNENMKKALVCKEDILQGVRKSALTDDMNDISKVYIERNGEISAIRKKKNDNA